MKNFLPFFLLLFSLNLLAQEDNEHLPCGTPPGISPWLELYTQQPQLYSRSADTLLYLPLGVHVVGTDDGSGFMSEVDVIDALCQLNEDFAASNIRCYIKGDIDYINDSEFYEHEDVIDGAFKMFEYNAPDVINCYIMKDPAGNCGYNLNYAGIALRRNCINPGDHTWVHEIAHHLTIQHTFLGWEGGITHDLTQPANYTQPAPEFVTYDYTKFKNQLFLDTLIIDTALVEKLDGSNCDIAADKFCDTPPDYLAFRWPCDNDGFSQQAQIDPDGNEFHSDGSFFISYSFDHCQSRFSDDQIAAMRANLTEEKDYLLQNQPDDQQIASTTELLFPAEGATVAPQSIELKWSSSLQAEKYIVELDVVELFTTPFYRGYVTGDTSLLVDLEAEAPYYWRVRPFNNQSFCAAYSNGSFFTGSTTATQELQRFEQLALLPNPAEAGSPLQLRLHATTAAPLKVSLYSLQGSLLQQHAYELSTGTHTLPIETSGLRPGMYLLRLQGIEGMHTEKVILK